MRSVHARSTMRSLFAVAIASTVISACSSSSHRDFGIVHTRFGDARAVCGSKTRASCGDSSAALFLHCSNALTQYLRPPQIKDAAVIVQTEQRRLRDLLGKPPSGTRWVETTCGTPNT